MSDKPKVPREIDVEGARKARGLLLHWYKELQEKDKAGFLIEPTDRENLRQIVFTYADGSRVVKKILYGRIVGHYEELVKNPMFRLLNIIEFIDGDHPSQIYGDEDKDEEDPK